MPSVHFRLMGRKRALSIAIALTLALGVAALTTTFGFEAIASFSPTTVTLSTPTDPESVQAERVSASYFAVLRARPMLGRVFTAGEDLATRPTPVVVIGEKLWRR